MADLDNKAQYFYHHYYFIFSFILGLLQSFAGRDYTFNLFIYSILLIYLFTFIYFAAFFGGYSSVTLITLKEIKIKIIIIIINSCNSKRRRRRKKENILILFFIDLYSAVYFLYLYKDYPRPHQYSL